MTTKIAFTGGYIEHRNQRFYATSDGKLCLRPTMQATDGTWTLPNRDTMPFGRCLTLTGIVTTDALGHRTITAPTIIGIKKATVYLDSTSGNFSFIFNKTTAILALLGLCILGAGVVVVTTAALGYFLIAIGALFCLVSPLRCTSTYHECLIQVRP